MPGRSPDPVPERLSAVSPRPARSGSSCPGGAGEPSQLLRGGLLVDLVPPRVEQADLRVQDGRIAARGHGLDPVPGEAVIDLSGRLVLPGMVNAHTHLYSALSRGMPGPVRPPRDFKEILELVWWRLDRALDEEQIYLSALVGALDAVRAGTTTIVDHHASPTRIPGSLSRIDEALETVGIRRVLCYEVTDRGGPAERDAGLAESATFFERAGRPLSRGLVGAHASFTLEEETLGAIGALARRTGAGVHIHVAEDTYDVTHARHRHGRSIVDRLREAGCLSGRTILAHGVHLEDRDLAIAMAQRCQLVHNPRSNMNNRVGYAPVFAPVGGLEPRWALGTDGIGSDMFAEAQFAYFKAQEANRGASPGAVLDLLASGGRLASTLFELAIGDLEPGSAGDLAVLDYDPPTPLSPDNLGGHVIFGMSAADVESVMVAGRWIMRERRFGGLDVGEIHARAREAATRLWKELAPQLVP